MLSLLGRSWSRVHDQQYCWEAGFGYQRSIRTVSADLEDTCCAAPPRGLRKAGRVFKNPPEDQASMGMETCCSMLLTYSMASWISGRVTIIS